ncbi:MAG: 2-C-methyl-D-erythritol 2,4-cyclodiphosphate synthase [Elusimicrobia bacterium]|nr:2-C-methyl-D-erythritol 2,4-cyclodiphosphate synthase [Elusimicrobiota bacterium]
MNRVGLGYDAHRFSKSRPLFLGGVRIVYHKGLEGHSDADVILHAIVDALLGAAGLPDIGAYFSNKDPRWKNVSSLIFLKEVGRILKKKKAKILNLDCVLLSEEPKIAPVIAQMKEKIADTLGLKIAAIGIKASTNERMGFVGRKEGMAACAVALLQM